MAKNRYLIIIPPHKEPYIKSFNNPDKALSIISSKTEGAQIKEYACDFFNRETVLLAVDGKKKKTLPANEKATYITPEGETKQVNGHALICGVPGDNICGFTLEEAEKMLRDINNIYIGA
ncbi:MAG: hypothetical protein IKB88_02115 [Clostridia bacterium]|nr:hypothetical protein [Clostridia bacterium]